MTNFVSHFHKEDIICVFNSYVSGIADCYGLYTGGNGNPYECSEVIHSCRTTFGMYHNEILESVAAEIIRYMNYYGVKPLGGVDEYKLIYFMGMRLAAFLENDGNELAAKVIRYSAVLMLDDRLKTFTEDRGRPELKERMLMLIKDGKVTERLGKDGLYLIYKCASNMLKP